MTLNHFQQLFTTPNKNIKTKAILRKSKQFSIESLECFATFSLSANRKCPSGVSYRRRLMQKDRNATLWVVQFQTTIAMNRPTRLLYRKRWALRNWSWKRSEARKNDRWLIENSSNKTFDEQKLPRNSPTKVKILLFQSNYTFALGYRSRSRRPRRRPVHSPDDNGERWNHCSGAAMV